MKMKNDEFVLKELTTLSFDSVKDFLYQQEAFCVQLCEKVLKKFLCNNELNSEKIEQSILNGFFYGILKNDKIVGIFFLSPAGLLLHSFLPEITSSVIPLLKDFFLGKKIYCISGESYGSFLLAEIIKSCGFPKPVEIRPYNLMIYDSTKKISDNLTNIVCCKNTDENELFLLQQKYDIVEVLPANRPFDENLCRYNLRKNLLLGRIVAIKQNSGIFIAKAGVNAVSENFVQIGGVFTKENFRKQGFACSLVNYIAIQSQNKNKKAVLFVRETNKTAQHSYKKAGFFNIGKYCIIYY